MIASSPIDLKLVGEEGFEPPMKGATFPPSCARATLLFRPFPDKIGSDGGY